LGESCLSNINEAGSIRNCPHTDYWFL